MVTAPPHYCVTDRRTGHVVFTTNDRAEAYNWRRWNLPKSGQVRRPHEIAHPLCFDDCPRRGCPHFFYCHGHWAPSEQLNP